VTPIADESSRVINLPIPNMALLLSPTFSANKRALNGPTSDLDDGLVCPPPVHWTPLRAPEAGSDPRLPLPEPMIRSQRGAASPYEDDVAKQLRALMMEGLPVEGRDEDAVLTFGSYLSPQSTADIPSAATPLVLTEASSASIGLAPIAKVLTRPPSLNHSEPRASDEMRDVQMALAGMMEHEDSELMEPPSSAAAAGRSVRGRSFTPPVKPKQEPHYAMGIGRPKGV